MISIVLACFLAVSKFRIYFRIYLNELGGHLIPCHSGFTRLGLYMQDN